MSVETSMGGGARRFGRTHWTVVLEARGQSEEALERLIASYWKPVYYYVRRWGAPVEDAKDLTQGFFAEFLARNFLKDVSPDKGRFRTFLVTTLRHFLINQAERGRALKRGGGRVMASLDFEDAERVYTSSLATTDPIDDFFRRQWALTVLERALAALQSELPEDRFEAFRIHLTPGKRPSYQETADQLGTTVASVKTALHRTRRRYRDLIREEVRASVRTEDEVDEEIRDLFEAL